MNQEKIGSFIKQIRKDNNLTQKELADKLGVTYQAVSKWENGLNIPDIGIIKEISKLYNIEVNEILDGEKKKKKKNIFIFITVILLILLGISIYIVVKNIHSDNIELTPITTSCSDFNINGVVAYNRNNASLQISKIDYCGVNDTTKYDNISCVLYEEKDGKKIEINACQNLSNLTLTEYLEQANIKVNNYSSTCRVFTDAKLYLEINANQDGINKEYIIPIDLDDNCTK